MNDTRLLDLSKIKPIHHTAEFPTEAARNTQRYSQDDVGKVVKVLSPLKWWLIVSVSQGVATFREMAPDLVSVDASEVTNDSSVAGTTVKAALDGLSSGIAALGVSSHVSNDSTVSGASVSDALNTLSGLVGFGGGAVSSVFGRTGAVTAHAGDYTPAQVGAPPVGRTLSAGAGLSGGGDLSANRSFAVDFGQTPGKVCEGSDPRLSNARPPTPHASSHMPGGSDALATGVASALAVGGSSAEGSAAAFARQDHLHALPPFGAIPGSFCEGSDARLSDARTPTSHAARHLPGGSDALTTGVASALAAGGISTEGSAAAFARQDHTHALPHFGAIDGSFCEGSDPRLSDARTPTSHAASHLPGGSDALTTGIASALAIGGGNAEGSAAAFARQDHMHALPPFGAIAGSFCEGSDARLSDARAPLAHALSHLPGGADALMSGPPSTLAVGGSNVEGSAAAFARQDHLHALPPFGAASGSFCEGDDPRLSDARTPTAHMLSHLPNGADALTTAVPLAVGTANSAGSGNAYSRSDHVHDASALLPRDGSRAMTGALNAGGNNLFNVAAVLETPTAFAWVANAAAIDVGSKNDFVASGTLTGNSTLSLNNGVDGCQGTVYVKQDATGARTLVFSVAGRTILRESGALDSNPQPAANSVTGYAYDFKTIGGTAYVIIERFYLT